MGPVLIVGAGAIGGWLAARLVAAGEHVVLLSRPTRARLLREQGLTLETLPDADAARAGSVTFRTGPTFEIIDSADSVRERPALCIVATRAYQTAEVTRALTSAGVAPGAVMTLQNGLGNAEILADAFGDARVLAGTTSHGVTWVEPTTARHAGAGDTRIGPWTETGAPAAADAARRLTAAGIVCEAVTDPRLALWSKVAVNAAINPPTAIARIENGALLDGGRLEADLRAAAREVAAVATAEGLALSPEAAEAAAVAVAQRTARNRSSMLQARLAGRPLETDAITGEVVRRAARHGIAVPVNARHLAALRALDAAV